VKRWFGGQKRPDGLALIEADLERDDAAWSQPVRSLGDDPAIEK
jgi:hypothetical protein